VPRIVVIPSPVFVESNVVEVGRAVEAHLDIVVAIDDEWRSLIVHGDDIDLALKLKMYILDALAGCKTGTGNICPAIVLHRSDIALLWLDDYGNVQLLSIKEMIRKGELLYAYSLEPRDDLKLFRLQTYKPQEHTRFFDEQFENLGLELYELLYGSQDLNRWRRITRATTLPEIARVVTEATRRYVADLCIFGEYNVCPGILLLGENRVDVKILKITSKPDYVARIDLAGLLASGR
jgi:hypothetical protein